jgi:hypothetical protein
VKQGVGRAANYGGGHPQKRTSTTSGFWVSFRIDPHYTHRFADSERINAVMTKTLSNVVAVGVVFASVSCSQRPRDDDSHMSCVERLEMPVYPPIAKSAMARNAIMAAALLAPDASVQTASFEVLSGHQPSTLFYPALEKSLKASKFSPTCGGRTVKIIFDFHFAPPSEPEFAGERVAFVYPNRFEIFWKPPHWQPE